LNQAVSRLFNGMKLVAGSFMFPAHSAAVARSLDCYMPYGVPLYYDIVWSVTCFLQSQYNTPIERQIDFSQQESIIRAFVQSSPNVRWALLCDNGAPTDLVLTPEATIITPTGFSGIKASNVSQLRDRGPEYAGMRELSFQLTAKTPVGDLSGVMIHFEETVSYTPSIPVTDCWVGINGSRGTTTIRPGTPVTATQSGSATGLLDWPQLGGENGAPRPLFLPPVLYPSSPPRFSRGSARQRDGGALMEYPIAWSYQYHGHANLTTTNPNRWIP
jgi:hypothetical protein